MLGRAFAIEFARTPFRQSGHAESLSMLRGRALERCPLCSATTTAKATLKNGRRPFFLTIPELAQ